MRRRGFALPLVVLLVFVGALAVSLMLERHSVQRLTVIRHRDAYVMHHASAGCREMFSRWQSLAHGPMLDNVGADGHCFRLELPDDTFLDFYAQDWQGRALINTNLVAGDQRWIAGSMRDDLATLPPEEQEGLTRQFGPIEISIATVTPPVLHALCRAIISDPDKALKAAERLIEVIEGTERDERRGRRSREGRAGGDGSARSAGIAAAESAPGMNRGINDDLADALRRADVPDEEREELMTYLTFTPVLWRVVTQKVDSQGRVLERSGGLALIDATPLEGFNQGGPFLTWEQLSIESPDWGEATSGGAGFGR